MAKKKGGMSTNTNSNSRSKGHRATVRSCPKTNPLKGRPCQEWGKVPLQKDTLKGLS